MKIALSFFFLCALSSAKTQTVNGIPFSEIESQFVQIEGINRGLTSKMKVIIDFGQPRKLLFSGNEMVLKDKDGKILNFNSMVAALNFMSENGYEFVNAYATSVGESTSYFYLLRRKTNQEEQAEKK